MTRAVLHALIGAVAFWHICVAVNPLLGAVLGSALGALVARTTAVVPTGVPAIAGLYALRWSFWGGVVALVFGGALFSAAATFQSEENLFLFGGLGIVVGSLAGAVGGVAEGLLRARIQK